MKSTQTLLSLSLVLLSFFSCKKELDNQQKTEYAQKGKEIAMATADRMLAEVAKNMKEGGVAQAAPFCNAHADSLTNEMASRYGVSIKRTSHLLRSEKNKPSAREQEILNQYQKQESEKQELKPIVEKNEDGSVQFYAPIKLAQKCTTCHGVLGETLTPKNDSIIKVLYPADKAIGYKEGDLRGIWSINFSKK